MNLLDLVRHTIRSIERPVCTNMALAGSVVVCYIALTRRV
jgi:hypothetical protein